MRASARKEMKAMLEGKSVAELQRLNEGGLILRDDIPEYGVWRNMRRRCLNRHDEGWPNYGGRGITVCEEWNDFFAWFHHIGRRPNASFSLERIDNNRGYEPGNVRWDTWTAQARNRRVTKLVGSSHGQATTDEEAVVCIKMLLADGRLSQWQIAELFDVGVKAVNSISSGRTWKHVSLPENWKELLPEIKAKYLKPVPVIRRRI
jgi:hypothetical protein